MPLSSPGWGRRCLKVYVVITDHGVEIREAEHLRGKSPKKSEAETTIRGELGLPGARGRNRRHGRRKARALRDHQQ